PTARIPYEQYRIVPEGSDEPRVRFAEPPALLLVINDAAPADKQAAQDYLDHFGRLIADENMALTAYTELVARARSIIGLRSSVDAEARQDLAEWLRTKADPSILGIVWLDAVHDTRPEAAEGMGLDQRLITRRVQDAERIVEAAQS